jgi:hypothetical protein
LLVVSTETLMKERYVKYIWNFRSLSNTYFWKGTATIYTLGPISEQIHIFHHYFYIIAFPLLRVYVLSYSDSGNREIIIVLCLG